MTRREGDGTYGSIAVQRGMPLAVPDEQRLAGHLRRGDPLAGLIRPLAEAAGHQPIGAPISFL